MTPLIAALGTVVALGGLFGLVLTFIPSPDKGADKPPSKVQLRIRRIRQGMTRRTQLLLATGLVAGVLFWAVTGWIVFVVIFPVALIGLPVIFTDNNEKIQTEKLSAIETWTRGLSGLMVTGAPLERALIASLSNTQKAIYPEVSRLVARLDGRWPTSEALLAFARDLNDPTGDIVVMNLLLASKQRGQGLVNSLNDLAQTVFEEVSVRRKVTADRSKPRWNARIVTAFTVGLLLIIPLVPAFSEPYKSPLGQLLFVFWIALIGLILLSVKKQVTPPPAPRMLLASGRSAS